MNLLLYLREAYSQVRAAHAIDLGRLLHTVQVQHESAERGVVWIGEFVDGLVHGVAADGFIIDARGIDELVVVRFGEERVRQFPEPLFQQAGNAIDVVLKGFGVAEIYLRSVCELVSG